MLEPCAMPERPNSAKIRRWLPLSASASASRLVAGAAKPGTRLGAHRLRHTVATHMVSSFKEAADVLKVSKHGNRSLPHASSPSLEYGRSEELAPTPRLKDVVAGKRVATHGNFIKASMLSIKSNVISANPSNSSSE
jgi:hypothetical protein